MKYYNIDYPYTDGYNVYKYIKEDKHYKVLFTTIWREDWQTLEVCKYKYQAMDRIHWMLG